MKIKFVKDVGVDYWNSSYAENEGRSYRSGAVIEVVSIEDLDKFHANLHFDSGDIALNVPINSFVISA